MAEPSTLNRRFFRTLPWAAFEGGTSLASGLLTTFVVGRTLGAVDVGRASLAISTVALVEIASAGGIQEAVVRARSIHTALTDSAHWASVLLSLAGIAGCCLLSLVLGEAYHDASIVPLTAVASLSLLFNAAIAVPSATLTRKMRAAALARRLAFAKLAALVALVATTLLHLGPWSLVVSYVSGSLAAALLILGTARRLPRPRFELTELRSLVGFASLFSLEAVLWTAALRLFGMIFGYFHGLDAYGLLQFAIRLVDDLANLIQRTVLRFGLSYFAALTRIEADSQAAFIDGSRLLTSLATPIFAGIALTAPDIVPVVFGARWLAAVPIIQIVAVSWIFGFPRSLVGPILRARGKQMVLVTYAAVTTAYLLLAAVATGHLSPAVATLAFCLRQVIAVPWGLWVIRRDIGIGILDQLASMLPGAVALLVMAVIIGALRIALAGNPASERLAIAAVAGAIGYGVTILVLDGRLRGLLGRLMRRLGRRARPGAAV